MALEPTEQQYNLLCRVRCFTKNIKEDIGTKILSYQSLICCLVPEQNDECMKFFQAWLPEVPEERYEVAAFVKVPTNGKTRLVVKYGDDDHNALGAFDGPYLQVMSLGLSKWLNGKKDGQRVEVVILPESADEIADDGIEANEGGYDLVPGQENFPGQS